MAIFRRQVPSVQAEQPKADTAGDAPDLSAVPAEDHDEAGAPRRKPYLAIPQEEVEAAYVVTGAELKMVVAAIADDETVCFIDVGEGQRPVLIKVAAGIAIVGRKI